MEDWVECDLGDVCEIQTGKYDANHANDNGKYRFYTCAYDFLYCDTNRFNGESLILPGNGANVGEVFYYQGEFDAYQRTYVLNKIKIYAKYLYYHLKGFWKSINIDKQYGSATNYIRMGNFTEYSFPLPPLPIQRAIVTKIENLFASLDKGIEDLKLAKEQLKIYRQAVLKKAFEGDLTKEWREKQTDLPTAWKITELGSVIDKPKYGTSKKCDYDLPGRGVLRIPNIVNGYVDSNDLKFAEFTPEEIETYSLEEGDLLIIRSNGSVNIVGKCALIHEKEKNFLYAGYLIRIRPNKNLIDSKFLLHNFYSIEMRTQIEQKAKSTSGVNNINSGEIQSLSVPIPSLPEQQQIVREIESRLSVCDKVEQSIAEALEKSEALRQSILKKAFEGRLLTDAEIEQCKKEADYEPSSVLLQRIKQEKAVI